MPIKLILNTFIGCVLSIYKKILTKVLLQGGLGTRMGIILTLRSSTTVSANPTTYMATATALAKAKIKPMEPPNSGPKLLEMR